MKHIIKTIPPEEFIEICKCRKYMEILVENVFELYEKLHTTIIKIGNLKNSKEKTTNSHEIKHILNTLINL